MAESKYKFLLAVLILLIRIYVGLIILVPAMYVETLTKEFSVSKGLVGLFTGSIMLAAAAMALFTGPITSKLGAKRGGLMAIGVIAATGYVLSFSPNFPTALIARLMMGFGVILSAPVFSPIIKTWYTNREYGRVNAIVESATSIGLTINFALTPILFPPPSWREAHLVYSTIAIVLTVLWAVLGRGPLEKPGMEGENYLRMLKTRMLGLLRIREVLLMAGVLFVAMGVTTGLSSWIPDFLHAERGYGIAMAAMTVAVYNVVNIISWPVGGFLSDRIGLRRPFMIVGGVMSFVTSLIAISVAGILPVALVLVFMGLFGLFNAVYGFASVTVLMEHPSIDNKAIPYAISIILFVAFLGGAIMPAIVGVVGDITGSTYYGLLICSILYGLVAVFGLLSRETGWRNVAKKDA